MTTTAPLLDVWLTGCCAMIGPVGGGLTVMGTAVEVWFTPVSSITLADSRCESGGAFDQANVYGAFVAIPSRLVSA